MNFDVSEGYFELINFENRLGSYFIMDKLIAHSNTQIFSNLILLKIDFPEILLNRT